MTLLVTASEQIEFLSGISVGPETFQARGARLFAKLVEEKTEGRVKIDIYDSGQLGTQREVVEALKAGGVQVHFVDPANLSQISPDVGVFNLPYLFRDAEHCMQAVDPAKSEVMKEIADKLLDENGIRLLGLVYWRGFRQLTCNSPVYNPEDLKGKKIRSIANKVWIAAVEGMGAIATPIDFAELPTALMTGIVDGQENPLNTIYDNSFFPPVQEYLMLTNHIGAAMIFVIREDAWAKMSPEDQSSMEQALKETANWSVEEIAKSDKDYLEKLKTNGMKVISEDDGLDVEVFRTRVLDHVKGVFPEWSNYIDKIVGM